MRIQNIILIVTGFLLSQTLFAAKPTLFLLKTYDDTKDVIGWVMSEKLDGIRGYWDGEKLTSRNGTVFYPPKWWVKNFPPFELDGELWTKRNDFENISSIIRQKTPDERWRQVRFYIFEIPNQKGGLLERLDVLEKYLELQPTDRIKVIVQTQIQNKRQLNTFIREVETKGGEGVVVRNPETVYQTGRLSSALKIKKYLDTECTVLEILKGTGRNIRRMGSIRCRMKNGKTIKIGSGFKDADRDNPPKIGSTVTFKYYGLTKNGIPKYPVYLRIRTR